MIRISRLNKRVGIQTAAQAAGSTGQPIQTWTTAKTVWVGIEPLNGQERLAEGNVSAKVSHRVVLRYNAYSALTSACRFIRGSRVFEIVSVVNVGERNEQWLCDCREVL